MVNVPDTRIRLNNFFLEVQRKALRQAEFALGDRDEALDIVQEAMIRLAKNYSDKAEEWPQLFQRILQNQIRDWYRRQRVRSILVWWNQVDNEKDTVEELFAKDMVTEADGAPEKNYQRTKLAERLVSAVQNLPFRQQQAFTLRAWWGHDVAQTAFAMGCSEGSVKTHYSRAVNRLRELLGDIEL